MPLHTFCFFGLTPVPVKEHAMRLIIFPYALFLFVAFPVHAAEIAAQSRITSVTVFTDRAAITREAVMDVPAGAHTVVFEGMPIGLYPDSLRAEGTGAQQVVFGAISQKVNTQADFIRPQEKALQDQIRVLEDHKLVLSAQSAALAKKKEFYQSLMAEAAARTREERADFNLKPEQWAAAADTVMKGFEDSERAIIGLSLQGRELDEQLQKLRTDLNQLYTGSRQDYAVTLPLEAAKAGRVTISLSYQISGATWRPVYDARLNTETGALDIVQYGAVQQNTGEEWKGVALSLSTAQPHRGSSLPDLTPMWLSLFQPYAAKIHQGFVRAGAPAASPVASNIVSEEALMMDGAAMEDKALEKAEIRAAQIDTGGFTAEYRIPGPSTVLSDGTESKLLVGSFETDSVLQVHVKPQLSADAYLVAKMTLKGDAPILPGGLSLFRDNAYVGQGEIPLLRPGKDHNLFFGIDDQIDVKRELLKEESGDGGLLNRDNVRERRFITTVQNLRKKPVTLALTESTPVSADEKIVATILKDATTPGYESDIQNKKGVLQWVRTLAPGEKGDIKLGWKVTWPKDSEISGL